MAKAVMRKFYRAANGHPEKLPWHQDAPPPILQEAVASMRDRGRALDVGCGAGVFTVWLAKQGFEVTGIDLFPEATAMARVLAEKNNARVELVTGDLFAYAPERQFDFVYDSGCMHALVGGAVPAYKQQLLKGLAPGGTYVLGHWGKLHPFDWRPIGPRRRGPKTVTAIFSPELRLLETEVADFAAPLPFGPTVRGIGYWFQRNQ